MSATCSLIPPAAWGPLASLQRLLTKKKKKRKTIIRIVLLKKSSCMHEFLPIVIDLSLITLESRFCPVETNNFLFGFCYQIRSSL